MEERNEWVFFRDIDWNCSKNNVFSVDTRDFHCGYTFREAHPDYRTISKYERFFLTEDELKSELERLYTESGGEKEWRLLELVTSDERVKNWNIKYLRIWRTEKGFVVCNSDHKAIPKDVLSCQVDKRFL